MAKEIKLPELGEGVEEGEIVKFLVNPGDSVSVDQPLVEIMTDKATVEVPSPEAGTVEKTFGNPGDVIAVGTAIISLTGGAAATASAPAPKQPSAPAPAPQMQASAPPVSTPVRQPAPQTAVATGRTQTYVASPGKVLATPATRRLARDLGVDLTQVPASGPNGRVTKEDLQKFAGAVAAGPAQMAQSMPSAIPATPRSAPAPQRSPLDPSQRETLIPFRGIRRKISEAMAKSRSTIADFTYVDECDISELVNFRKDAKATAEKLGYKLTYMPFICKAIIRGLKEFPYMNSELDEAAGHIKLKNYYNIGMAVDTKDGLVVPVIKDADKKSILELAGEMQLLADKARTGKLSRADITEGTFTITNAGNIGGMLATPVINYPEVAIFGVHKISRRPVVKKVDGKETITIADVIWLSIAVDHRVVDGAMAGRFMNVVMEYLTNPKKLMLDMA